jgi:hypothetical protein
MKAARAFLTRIAIPFVGMGLGTTALAADAPPASDAAGAPPAQVRYRAGKDVSFDELLIQGQLQRPEITVVTGNADQGTNGLLRLRENFVDRMVADFGEEEAAQ